MKTIPKVNIAIVDDHQLMRESLAFMLLSQNSTQSDIHINIALQASNGKDFIEKLRKSSAIDIVLLDIKMPVMNGFETAEWIRKNHPGINVIGLSMYSDRDSIIRMLKNGARGYLLKDASRKELMQAIEHVHTKGFFMNNIVSNSMLDYVVSDVKTTDYVPLTEKEMTFIKYACSELTYREIGEEMGISPRTVENYRDTLFQKLNVMSRVGLVMYAIKHGFI